MKFDRTGHRLENSNEIIYNVHDPANCAGRECTIHNRRIHHMRSWPQHYREDKGVMERLSPFGCGCPDPDDIDWRGPSGRSMATIHGCIVHPFTGSGICQRWELHGWAAAWLYNFPGYAVTRDGRIWSWHPDDTEEIDWTELPEEVAQEERKGMHPKVNLLNALGEWLRFDVRAVVWQAWHGEPIRGSRIVHVDGDRFNNSLENLIPSSQLVVA